MKKAKKPSYEMADDLALTDGLTVKDGLTGNPNYPSPPKLADYVTALNDYSAALGKAKYGSRDDKATKNAKKRVVISLMRELCDYVNDTAETEEALASSGFPLSKTPQPRVLGTAEIKVVINGSGKVTSSTPTVSGGITYKHQYSKDPLAPLWPEQTTTRATCKHSGLTPGVEYSFRIVTIGTNGQETVSEMVTKMVA